MGINPMGQIRITKMTKVTGTTTKARTTKTNTVGSIRIISKVNM